MTIYHSRELDMVADIMKDFKNPWFISGGWTIDLGIGKITRPHDDIDICIFREHSQAVLEYFRDWDIKVAIPGEGRLEPVNGLEDMKAPRYGLHLTKNANFIEVLLTDCYDDKIPFRRDTSIQIELNQFKRTDDAGRNFVAPEFQLLYKAKEGRKKDQDDFFSYLPYMNDQQKVWLRTVLEKHMPASSWIRHL